MYHYFKINIEWYYALGTIALVTWSTWESGRLLERFFQQRLSSQKDKVKWFIGFLLAGSFFTTLFTIAIVLMVSMMLHNHSFNETLIPLKLNLIYAWLANLLFHLINTIFFYFKEYKTKWIEAEELKKLSAQAELQLVKNQINPHFLFNNLNVLSTLVMQNNSEANRFIEAFSNVYRYILQNHDKELVELKTELHYIHPYIFLLETRFTGGLKINLRVPDKYGHYLIIPAALQLLIENAIKHNIVSRSKPLHIDVHVNGNNTLVVSNNLQVKQHVEGSSGIGLKNIIKRYRAINNLDVAISDAPDFFTVELPLITAN